MANTGYKQATVAYVISPLTGEPLDVNGVPTRVSGRRQAIYILAGTENPDSLVYEIKDYFQPRGFVMGVPTYVNDGTCAAGFITVTPVRLLLGPSEPSGTLTVSSSDLWRILPPLPEFVTFDMLDGPAGQSQVNAEISQIEGQGYVYFENLETGDIVRVYISNLTDRVWILETGNWNMQGFWFNDAIWNY